MAITVGDYKEFLSDSAGSMADAKAGRILERTMGAALRRLSREGEWTWKRKRALLNFESRLTSKNMTLTNGSSLVTLDSTVLGSFPLTRKHYDDKWNVQLGGRETAYVFAEPPQPYSFRLTLRYPGASTPVTIPATYDTLVLTRSRYELPERFSFLFSVDLPQQGVAPLQYLSRSEFEAYRIGLLNSASQPWVYTTYGNEGIEIWPPPASDSTIETEIDYQAELRYPEIGALDTEEIDWPSQYEDLLWAVGRLQLAIELGADAVQFDVQSVAGEYSRLVTGYQAADQGRGKKTWLMGGTPFSGRGTPRPFGLNLRGPVAPGPG